MTGHARTAVVALLAVAALAVFARVPLSPEVIQGDAGAYYALAGANGAELDAAARARGMTFDASVTPAARELILSSVAGARPEARRLIDLVDGITTVRVGATGGSSLGVTSGNGRRFDVVLDLDRTLAELGGRGVSRLVLHEFGHVVDYALVPTSVDTQLDAGIPAGYACAPGETTSACAPREERFAETFAKWANGDIGVNLNIGYAVMPPTADLGTWGAPLAALGA
jgi:hypothetical protein